jgi:putative PIN family toxin of toxin-antitoxin system
MRLRIVLDTNILVSGLFSSRGAPGQIVDALNSGLFSCYVCDAIIQEYTDVLFRPEFEFTPSKIESVFDSIKRSGIFVNPISSLHPMPDESDRIFYDVAKSADAYLITGNSKHFPNESFILSPAEFIKQIMNGER